MSLLRVLLLTLVLLVVQPFQLTSTAAQSEPTYVDDRSGPTQVLASLVNAINRREYARAYAYWNPQSPTLPSYPDFAAGYANTVSIELVTGAVQSDPGAGQLYYSMPVTLRSRLSDGTMQSFVGCYVLHISQPALQEPPFRPLAIRSALVRQVANDADHGALMREACAAGGTRPPDAETDPSGSAVQDQARPLALCPDSVGCEYLEHSPWTTVFRFQSLSVCGANCSAHYWVTNTDTGRQVLEIGPVRGAAIVAAQQPEADPAHPSVRVVQPSYAPGDAGCCPSSYSDTTYVWDPATSMLVATDVVRTLAEDFGGWDAAREQLQSEGWFLVNV